MTARSVLVLAFVLCAAKGFAHSAVPPAGLAAEAAGEWAQARDVYRRALEGAPHDASLWVRVADIEARLGNVEASASALQHAVQETPHDPALLQRLSQAYAILDQPVAALDAVERALALSPDSIEVLRVRGTLATWVADYTRAQDAYRRLSLLAPDDHDVLLTLARVSAWSGRTDAAVEAFTRYVEVEPDAAAVLIELVGHRGQLDWSPTIRSDLQHRERRRGQHPRTGGTNHHVDEQHLPIQFASYNDVFGSSFEDMRRRVPDITKIRQMVGFQPKVHLDEILERVIEYWETSSITAAPARPALMDVGQTVGATF